MCNNTGDYPTLTQWLNAQGGAMASDHCSGISWSNNYSTIDCEDTLQIVEFAAIDQCNNSRTSSGVIIIKKVTATIKPTDNQGLEVISAYPNPFGEQTKIVFSLPKFQKVKITLFNAQGQVLKLIDKKFKQGINELDITRNDLNSSGIIFYKFESNTQIVLGKIVAIE